MIVEHLQAPWQDCKPQDKFIYIRWMDSNVINNKTAYSIFELSDLLSLKHGLVRQSIHRLLIKGLIKEELHTRVEKTGRKHVKKYMLSNLMFERVGRESDKVKLKDIQRVLGMEVGLYEERAECLAKRLVKAILLCFSDSYGFVENLGLTELSILAGMTVQRVRRYKDELIESGFIIYYLAGANMGDIYPRAKSIFVIDPKQVGKGAIVYKINEKTIMSGRNFSNNMKRLLRRKDDLGKYKGSFYSSQGISRVGYCLDNKIFQVVFKLLSEADIRKRVKSLEEEIIRIMMANDITITANSDFDKKLLYCFRDYIVKVAIILFSMIDNIRGFRNGAKPVRMLRVEGFIYIVMDGYIDEGAIFDYYGRDQYCSISECESLNYYIDAPEVY